MLSDIIINKTDVRKLSLEQIRKAIIELVVLSLEDKGIELEIDSTVRKPEVTING